MSKPVKFWLDMDAFSEAVLKSEGMVKILQQEADTRKARAGEGYESSVSIGRRMAFAMVYTDTPEAMRDNSDNNTLLKVLK